MNQAQVEDPAGTADGESSSFLLTGVFAVLVGGALGLISWFVLNVLVTVIAVPICCITACSPCLSAGYTEFAYWLPYIAWGLITALIWRDLVLQDKAQNQVERA